jgi:hypothetical protein
LSSFAANSKVAAKVRWTGSKRVKVIVPDVMRADRPVLPYSGS